MGFLKNMKDAMGQAQEAAAGAAQWQQNGGGASAGIDITGAMASRGSLQSQAHEQNRILSVGHAGTALIRGHVDTGENIAGNPVWIFDLEITPENGATYSVEHREIVSSMAMGSYGDGTSLACRIDPADPQKIAFGEKPFMERWATGEEHSQAWRSWWAPSPPSRSRSGSSRGSGHASAAGPISPPASAHRAPRRMAPQSHRACSRSCSEAGCLPPAGGRGRSEGAEADGAQPRISMLEGVKMANQAYDHASGMQQQWQVADPAAFGGVYASGLQGTATVNAIGDSGVVMNGAPVCELDLTVTVPGREPYQVKHPPAARPVGSGPLPARLDVQRPGGPERPDQAGHRPVTVKFDPNRRRQFVLLEESYEVTDHVQQAVGMMNRMAGMPRA